ncbi:MAG TPA: hypothetical protein PLE45_09715 [Spirochaetota bacterium]|nr:hypothetical protein [Spirochaetota bacterium]HOL57338.1 hypothetical protein [Spirochaetota bacterium]HPP04907.1 hypothetical protein [Spirochaetota bacterium]
MGVGLLRKALIYREKYLNKPKKGLLKRALEYLETLNNNYPQTINNIDISEKIPEIGIETELIEEKDHKIEDIDISFNEEIPDNEVISKLQNIEAQSKENILESNIEELQLELMEDLSKIENIEMPEGENIEENVNEENEEAELEEVSIIEPEIESGLEVSKEEPILEEEIAKTQEDEKLNEIKKEEELKEELETLEKEEILEEVIEEENNEEKEDENIGLEEINEGKILQNINESNLNEVTKNKLLNEEYISKDRDFNKKYYYNILKKVSKDFATLVINTESYKDFLKIISDNFNISKSALLIYSPQQQRFICWHSKNIDSESVNKLNFDLNFGNIYKNIAKEKAYLILPNNPYFENIEKLLSSNDKNNSDFQLWVPFIFSARIIGILLSLQLYDRSTPTADLIESLEIIGRLNGALLYNLFQHYNITFQKKNELKSENQVEDLKEINEEEKKEIEIEIADKINNNNSMIDEEIPIEEIFPEKYHKLVYFTQQKLKETPNMFISFISIKLTNKNEIENNIPNFKTVNFLSDIQFIAMNIAGTNSFLQVYDDFSMIIILPEVKKSVAANTSKVIIDETKMMFNEIFGGINLDFKDLVLSFPEDSNKYIEIFHKLINF